MFSYRIKFKFSFACDFVDIGIATEFENRIGHKAVFHDRTDNNE